MSRLIIKHSRYFNFSFLTPEDQQQRRQWRRQSWDIVITLVTSTARYFCL